MPKTNFSVASSSTTTTSPSSASSSKSWRNDKVDLNAHFDSKKKAVPTANTASPRHSSSSSVSTSNARAALFNKYSEKTLAHKAQCATNLECLYRKSKR